MPFVPFLNPSDTYLNYQRPRGFLDVITAAIVTGLAKDVLLQRFLAKNLKAYLDFEPYRGQGILRELLLKKHLENGLTGEVGSLPGPLFIEDLRKPCEIPPGVYPLTQAGLELLIPRHEVGYEGEELLADLCVVTPEADKYVRDFKDTEVRIFVRLDNPLFTGHPAFHPCDLVRFEDLEEVMRISSTSNSSESEAAWSSNTETKIFDPYTFPAKYYSNKSFIDLGKEQRLSDLFTDWALQLKEVRESGKMESSNLDKLKTSWPMENLFGAFSAMAKRGWMEEAHKKIILGHFTNSTLKDSVPKEIPKLNWLESKSLLHNVMRKLDITFAAVHRHFLHRSKAMSPIRSGLKDTERSQWRGEVEKLLKNFRP